MLHVHAAQAQCDRTPRLVWSYPANGAQDVSPWTPVLVRTTADIATVRITTSSVDHGALMTSLPLVFGDVIYDTVALSAFWQNGGPASFEITALTGEKLTLDFTISEEASAAPTPVMIDAHIDGHFVGAGLDRLSPYCRAIATAPGPQGCIDPARDRMIGLDARIDDPETGLPADVTVRAWWIAGVGAALPEIGPRLWPAECGPPMFLMPDDSDDPSVCVSVIAFVDGAPAQIVFPQHCLGGGQPWPELQAPDAGSVEPDAGSVPDAAVIAPPPPMMCGPCGCFVPGCDLIDPFGTAGTVNPPAPGGAGGAGGAGTGGASGNGIATGEAKHTGDSGGCGCTLAKRTQSPGWPLLALTLAGLMRLRSRRHASADLEA